MSHPERYPNEPQTRIPQQENTAPQSWKDYVQQLGERFQVRITEPDNKLVLRGRDPQRRLLIGTQRTFAVVSHGQRTEDYDLLPDEEILFDITSDGDWVPSEIMHSDEALDDYQEKLKHSNLPLIDEQTFDGERFAVYVLDKVIREGWFDTRI